MNRLAQLALAIALLFSASPIAAQLPPAIEADRLLVQAERLVKEKDYDSALETLDRILVLQEEHDLNIPAEFWFKRAQIAHEADQHDKAIDSVTRYLEIAGQEGQHYRQALELLDAAELERAWPQPGVVFSDALRGGGRGPEMVVIPAGSFQMGCVSGLECLSDEKPVHTVTIPQPFTVSKYEITFEDYDRFTYPSKVDDEGWGRGWHPIINVSWNDAKEYVAWLSSQTGQQYRLLTEAEWEYAARAGSETKYSWGNEIGRNRANCDGCGSRWDNEMTAPAGSFGSNAFGLHDMHGNVWEWVEDCWNDSYTGAPPDGSAWPRGDCGRRVLRGGSWFSLPRSLRSANRSRDSTGIRSSLYGFRVARTLSP